MSNVSRVLLVLLFLLLGAAAACAQTVCPYCGRIKVPANSISRNSVSVASDNTTTELAKYKARFAATHNIKGHVLSSLGFGAGRYEGVGWSSHSPQRAIDACCYSGKPGSTGQRRPRIAVAVSQALNGTWYACAIYR